jgi:hypothetical protein
MPVNKDLELDDIHATLKQRGSQYKDNWVAYMALKRAVADTATTHLTDQQQYCIDMMLMKISRIVRGEASKEDTWHDISGYAELGKPSSVPPAPVPPVAPPAPMPTDEMKDWR